MIDRMGKLRIPSYLLGRGPVRIDRARMVREVHMVLRATSYDGMKEMKGALESRHPI